MIVKALLLPVIVIALLFGATLAMRVVRDKRLILGTVPVALAVVLLAGMAALFKFLLLAMIAALAALAIVLIRKERADGR
ncbi:MAG: hypothetical protein M1548_00135 [Actinobacteria bacterium]|nr:hypothetical protein [Actinomycetota bacterium]